MGLFSPGPGCRKRKTDHQKGETENPEGHQNDKRTHAFFMINPTMTGGFLGLDVHKSLPVNGGLFVFLIDPSTVVSSYIALHCRKPGEAIWIFRKLFSV